MTPERVSLSLLEKIDLGFRLATAPLRLLLALAFSFIPVTKGRIHRRLWLPNTIFGVLLRHLKPRHIQVLAPSTSETYTAWIQKQHLYRTGHKFPTVKHNVERLLVEPEASILWIGNPERATRFVLFFHGGGYMAPLNIGHLNWCWRCYVEPSLEKGKEEVAVAVLQYSLAPGARYPTQLMQAAAALSHLLERGIAPHNLIFGGDSAGGNLAMQLLFHLLRPVPEIPPVILETGGHFAGIFLVSPWVSSCTDTVSYRDNDGVDMLSKDVVLFTQNQVLREKDFTLSPEALHPALPLDGDRSWFGSIEQITKALYVTCGSEEVFRDAVREFSEAVRLRNSNLLVELEVAQGEVHDAILIEGVYRKEDGDATRRMNRWASSRLQL